MSSKPVQLRKRTWEAFWEWHGLFQLTNGSLGPNPNGYQCVNPPNNWWARFNLLAWAGNAVDFIGREDGDRKWLSASSRLKIRHGDVIVFRPEWVGPNGHVAVVLDGSKPMVASFDQNWPLGAPVSEVWHNRASVAGVVRLRGYDR